MRRLPSHGNFLIGKRYTGKIVLVLSPPVVVEHSAATRFTPVRKPAGRVSKKRVVLVANTRSRTANRCVGAFTAPWVDGAMQP